MRVPTTSPMGAFQEDSFRYSPLEHIRTLFVRFLQGLFYASPPGAYHWEPTLDTSEISISDESPVHVDQLGFRPAISITRGPIRFHTLGFDDMLSYNLATGTKQKSVLVPGTMTINCSSRVPLEAERLAWICAEQLWLHREMLMAAGFFEVGRQPIISAPSPPGSLIVSDSADEWTVVSVTCPFQFYRTSQATPLGQQIVRSIQMSMRTELQPIENCGAPMSYGADPPYSVQGCPPTSFAPDASDANGYSPNPGQKAPVQNTVPHPLNPAQQVVVRRVRPNCPGLKPPSIRSRSIPLDATTVEESCGKDTTPHVLNSVVKT